MSEEGSEAPSLDLMRDMVYDDSMEKLRAVAGYASGDEGEAGFGGAESDGESSDGVHKGKKHCLEYLSCVRN